MMGVRVGQASGAFYAPYGIEPANHMSSIEHDRHIKFRATYLSFLGNARVYLPARALGTKKWALPSILTPVIAAKPTGSAHGNAEVLVSQLKWAFLRRSLDSKKIVFNPEQWQRH